MKQSDLKNKKILITGGAGFIGFHLAKLLSENPNYQIAICDNFFRFEKDEYIEKLLEQENVKLIEIDLFDKDSFEKLDSDYDYVYHLAAINGTKYFYEMPHKVLRNNILSDINILDWFVRSNSKKILFSSSCEAYASSIKKPEHIPTPETIPLSIADVTNPRWSYAGSKIAGELLFINYARIYKFDTVIIRYHNVYGPRMGRDGHVIPDFINRIYNKENPFNIYGGQETRTFNYVDDANKITKELMENDKANGKIINVGDENGKEIKIIDLAKKLFKIAGYKPEIKINPAPKGSVLRRCPDLALLKEIVDYKSKVGLEQGLLETYQWYLKDLNK